MLNTYIYHQLHPTCFGVCYTIFRESIGVLAQTLYALLQCCHKMYNIHCNSTVNLKKNRVYCTFYGNIAKSE